MSNIFKYTGTAYKQGLDKDSPWLLNFVASVDDVDTWSGIPRRSVNGLVGFQRPDDPKRVYRAQEFFNSPENQSPTALILGVHRVSSDEERRFNLKFIDGDDNSTIRKCEIEIHYDTTNCTLENSIKQIKSQIELRLEEINPNRENPYEDIEDPIEDNSFSEDEDDSVLEFQEIELGRSLLMDLSNKLNDKSWCENNKDDLIDLAKPCTIIDGQHRLKGSLACERGIPFTIVAIYDCSWSEQVFQFTVVNYTAKGIPDQFITANAALSLTGVELDDLKTRLTQAKVKVTEYELMKVINFESTSPFYQRVSMASSGNEPDKIGYKTMVKIAKAWHSGKNPAVKKIINNLYPDVKGKSAQAKRERQTRWMQDEWGIFFIAFWTTIKEYYEGKAPRDFSPWEIGSSNLMIAAVLMEYQNTFFMNLAMQDDDYFEIRNESSQTPIDQLRGQVKKRAEKVAGMIPIEFFQATWKMKSLNTGVGLKAIQGALNQFTMNSGNYQYEKSSLITGKTS
jgi:hypothetical protein